MNKHEEVRPGGSRAEGDWLSTPEVSAGISRLSASDKLKLRKAARFIARINGLDDAELLQEALVRAFEGRRRCRRGLPIVPFLFGAMRSIASSALKSARRAPVDWLVAAAENEDWDEEILRRTEPAADDRTPEREAMAKDMLQKIDRLFEDDADVQMLIYAIAEGFEGQGLRDELGWTQTQHDTVRKRKNRKLDEWLMEARRA